ncbi:MAG: hypothetical protein PUB18_00175 [bacterium]|nr:hypothetical protein [bacterium]
MKIDFLDDDHIVVFLTLDCMLCDEDSMPYIFQILGKKLKILYDYDFRGYYHVYIYKSGNVSVLELEKEYDYGKADFDVTMFLNSLLLYEFEDSEYVQGPKLLYNRKYYVKLDEVSDRFDYLEYGKIIYGDLVDTILKRSDSFLFHK